MEDSNANAEDNEEDNPVPTKATKRKAANDGTEKYPKPCPSMKLS